MIAKYLVVIFICFMLFGQSVFGQSINFSWEHDTAEKVEGYNFYAKEYPDGEFVKVWTGTGLNYVFDAKDGVKYGFAVTAYNGVIESLRSIELIYTAEGDTGEPILIPSRPKFIIMTF